MLVSLTLVGLLAAATANALALPLEASDDLVKTIIDDILESSSAVGMRDGDSDVVTLDDGVVVDGTSMLQRRFAPSLLLPKPATPLVGTVPLVSADKFNKLRGDARSKEIARVAKQFQDAHYVTPEVALCATRAFLSENGRFLPLTRTNEAFYTTVAKCEQQFPGANAKWGEKPYIEMKRMYAALDLRARQRLRVQVHESKAARMKITPGFKAADQCVAKYVFPDSVDLPYPGEYTQRMWGRFCAKEIQEAKMSPFRFWRQPAASPSLPPKRPSTSDTQVV